MKHFLAVISLVFSSGFSLSFAEEIKVPKALKDMQPAEPLSSMQLVPLHVAESKGKWLQVEDFEGIQAQFKRSPYQRPIELRSDKLRTKKYLPAGESEEGKTDLDYNYELLFSTTIHNNESRCVFYEIKKFSGHQEIIEDKIDLYSTTVQKKKGKEIPKNILDTWSYNKAEEVPKIWEEPGIFPLSFSMTSKGRLLKVLCATKKHINTNGTYDGKAAFTSYALLLDSYGVDLKKNGRNFKAFKEVEPEATETRRTQSTKPDAQR